MAKNNIRSIRYSDAIAEIIEAQPGDSWNDKFEKLVLKCYHELPEKENQLAAVQERIDSERERASAIYQKINQLNDMVSRCNRYANDFTTSLNIQLENLKQM